MAKSKRTRKRYSLEKRAQILAAASKEGLTAAAVQKRFGVSAVTYYAWRKKAGKGKRRRRGRAAANATDVLGRRVQKKVEARVRELLPKVVEAAVDRYVDRLLSSGRR